MRLRVALIAAVAAIGAVVLFVRHRGSASSVDSPSKTADAETATEANRTTAPTRSRTPRHGADPGEQPEQVRITGLPEQLHAGYLAVEHAAKDCYRGRPAPKPIRPNGPDETIESLMFAYDMVVNGGIGHVEELTITEGELTDADLQACIVEAITAATWDDVADDGLLAKMKQEINLGDLMRRDHGLLPESERPPIEPVPADVRPLGPSGNDAPEPDVDEHAPVYDSADPPSK